MWLNTNQFINKKPLYVSYVKYSLILFSLTLLISTASAVPTFIEISTPEELQNMTQYLNRDYVLTQDIDMTGFGNFEPIGNGSSPFTGSLDGQNYTITGLYINRPDTSEPVGMFGGTNNALIKNIGLENVNISGNAPVGGLIGEKWWGAIENSYSTGYITGEQYVGGLVGEQWGSGDSTIENSYSTCDVTGRFDIGSHVGGLVGFNGKTIKNSYATGDVKSNGNGVGGLIGTNGGTIENSYSTGAVTGESDIGGLIGKNQSGGTINNSYWDIETSGLTNSAGGESKTTSEMKNLGTYVGWDFTNTWKIHPSVNDGYPYLVSLFDSYEIFEGGDGSSDNPYQISNVIQLQAMTIDLYSNYTLVNDIDASETENWNSESGIFKGFQPIGNNSVKFTGTFDGQNNTITGLFINRTMLGVGLFGYTDTGATIKNVELVDVNITGENYVGGLVGFNNVGIITDSHSTGEVTGENYVGGLVGTIEGDGKVENSYSTCKVTGDEFVSGLVGFNSFSGIITNSYSTGEVSGNDRVGGLVGHNIGNIVNSYSTGNVNGTNWVGGLVGNTQGFITDSYSIGEVTGISDVGGLVATNTGTIENSYSTAKVTGDSEVGGLVGSNAGGTIDNSYSVGDVEGNTDVGGLVGTNTGTITESYWDSETSSQSESAGGVARTTSQMKQQSTFIDWDFTHKWEIHCAVNNGYPYLQNLITSYPIFENGDGSENNPYEVSTICQLQAMNFDLSAHYILINDIDISDTKNWNGGEGWEPIGDLSNKFNGTFDGQNYTITGLFINRPTEDNIGLFGRTDAGATIKNVGLVDINITGRVHVGGLVGYSNGGTIIDSYSMGDVTGNTIAGGLVGRNKGTIENSYSTGDVIGFLHIGGLVGINAMGGTITDSYSMGDVTSYIERAGGLVGYNEGTIMDSYSTGAVTGESNIGGLIGWNNGGTISNSYWDIETSGLTNSAGGESKTTSEMKNQTTYNDWDFINKWNIHPAVNDGYPYLQSLYDSYTIVEDDDVAQPSRSSRQQNIADSKSPSENIDTLFSNRQNVGVGSKVEYHVTADDIPVTLISFDSNTNEGIVENRINLLNNVPEGTPSQTAPVYKFMEINVGRTGTIGSHNADNIFIYFKVDKKWVEENTIIPESIRMERLNNGVWERLPTEQLDEDEEFFYFLAQTSGFSIFSIAGDERTVTEETNIVASFEEQPIDNVEDENKSNLYMIVGILIVAIMAIGFVIYKRKVQD
ncbi:GLUG motif-containing protein [Methanolobus halotolerans]|uniref:GLUG domain-containing protein n=1 Tax=Methanolobus halotolerans TaxID=2052935 RepID=A0A4E0PXI5_9EURY|nr:GLUG motif-containing protein [Methanolobus halotolerans]TGC09423.1 hypothetical protein CUN85_06230 [Methanolobus halotolerans]